MNFEDLQDIIYSKYESTKHWINYITHTENKLNIIHMNICSLRKHFNEFIVLIKDCLPKLELICLTEINIKEEEVFNYEINGYCSYYLTRPERRGGGIMIYVHENMVFEILKKSNLYCELIHGQIVTKRKKIDIIITYRPPQLNKSHFIFELKKLILDIPVGNDLVLMGDCNINILRGETDSRANEYLNTLSELGLECCIQDVTREVVLSERRVTSCIDHIFVRSARPCGELHAYVLTTTVSDHYLTGLSIEVNKQLMPPCYRTILVNEAVKTKLCKVEWTKLLCIDDPLELYKQMCDIFGNIYSSSETKKLVKQRESNIWVDKKLQKMLEIKDALFRKWKANPKNMSLRLEYTKYRNKANKAVNVARNIHRRQELINCNGDMRKVWECANKWLGRKKLNVDDVIQKYLLSSDQKLESVCNNFCYTFTNEIGLLKQKHLCNRLFYERCEYVKESNVSFRFKKVCPTDISLIIDKLSCSKSPGSDGIRVQDLKTIKYPISQVLAYFINKCIDRQVYPNELKTSIIRPIFKGGNHKEYTNYRPIAILSVINKIFEKIIIGQITKFLENNNILTDIQHGFRPNRSTATALSKFTNDINVSLNSKEVVLLTFIDFKKAFDTLEHEGLLQAMDECGIRGPVKRWFRQYLDNRNLKVRVKGVDSNLGKVDYGVPTGSVYGPIGYIMHVNSMVNVIKNCNAYMYADDTCLTYSGRDCEMIRLAMQEDLDNVVKWAHDNGILININKTKCMLISSPYSHIAKNACISIKGHSYECLHDNYANCQCECIERVAKYKYLGLLIDERFTWDAHVDTICNRLRSVLGKLNNLKYIVSRQVLYILYHALAEATINYGLGGYGLTFPVHLNKIKVLQIRLLKLLVNKAAKDSISKEYEKLFKICRILPIQKKVKSTIILEQHNNNEHKVKKVYNRPTRKVAQKNKYLVPKVTNYFGQRTRQWLVPTLLNELPREISTETVSKNALKNILRKHYLSLCP